jgi:hypothetical protein
MTVLGLANSPVFKSKMFCYVYEYAWYVTYIMYNILTLFGFACNLSNARHSPHADSIVKHRNAPLANLDKIQLTDSMQSKPKRDALRLHTYMGINDRISS